MVEPAHPRQRHNAGAARRPAKKAVHQEDGELNYCARMAGHGPVGNAGLAAAALLAAPEPAGDRSPWWPETESLRTMGVRGIPEGERDGTEAGLTPPIVGATGPWLGISSRVRTR